MRVMQQKTNILFILFAVLFCSLGSAADLSEERKSKLIHLLRHDCGSCHGMTLKGGLGPELTPESLAQKPADFLVATIMQGRAGTAMPPWKNMITNDDARWLVYVIKSGVSDDK